MEGTFQYLLVEILKSKYKSDLYEFVRTLFFARAAEAYECATGRSAKEDEFRFTENYMYIDDIYNANFNNNLVNFDIDVTGICSFNKVPVKNVHVYVQCQMKLDEIITKFKFVGVSLNKKEARFTQGSVACDGNLVPIHTGDRFEELAKNLISTYYPDAYNNPMAFPVERIIEELGITVDSTHKLSVKGLICLSNETIETLDGDVSVSAYTILIDRDLLKTYGLGCYRYTLLHELIHYEFHRYYFNLRKIIFDDPATSYGLIKTLNDNDAETRIERQAESVPALVLLPTFHFKCMYDRTCKIYDLQNTTDIEGTLNKIINTVAGFFRTSKECVKNRIVELGLDTRDVKIKSESYETIYITEEEARKTYEIDANFRMLVDSEKIVFRKNRYVINDKKYATTTSITQDAYLHPSMSSVRFTRHRSKNYRRNSEYFAREIMHDVDVKTIKCDQEILKNLDVNIIDDIYLEDQYRSFDTGDVGTTLKKIRESKGIGLNQLCSMTSLKKDTIINLESGCSNDIEMITIAKYCRGLSVPFGVVDKLLSKVQVDHDQFLSDRLIYETIKRNYGMSDRYRFFELLDAVKVGASKCVQIQRVNASVR